MITLPRLRRLHKWVAIIAGIQIVLWCVSGATFAWLDHHAVEAEHAIREPAAPTLADVGLGHDVPWAGPGARPFHEARLERIADRWVYRVERSGGVELIDARTGSDVRIDQATIAAVAAARYAGDGRVSAIEYHAQGALEARTHGPAWAVHYDDDTGTTLWFAATDARLLAARSDTWRVFDFFWMLHTMDYRGRDDFNHPLVILFATASLWVALTGLLLVVRVFRPRRPATNV